MAKRRVLRLEVFNTVDGEAGYAVYLKKGKKFALQGTTYVRHHVPGAAIRRFGRLEPGNDITFTVEV